MQHTAIVVIFSVLLAGISVDAMPQRAASTPVQAKTTTNIAAQSGPAVVTVEALDGAGKRIGQGSGFVVRPDGVVVTNWHVLAGASAATITLKTGESFSRVMFLDGDEAADIAVLKVPGFGMPVVRVVPEIPAVGARVITMGSPLGLSGTVAEGIVSALRIADGRQLVQITAPISPGSSGGPVMDASGAAFAISTLTMEKGQQLNFAVPVKYAMGLIRSEATGRPLTEVFVSSPGTRTGPTSDSAASSPPIDAKPERTKRPVASLDGTYLVRFESGQSAVLVVANDNRGLLMLSGDKRIPFDVRTLRTNSTGEVAASFDELVSGGYQTEGGFWASGRTTENRPFSYVAERYTPPISEDTGVYEVRVRTSTKASRGVTGPPIDWTGEAAVITAGGRVYVSMALRTSGGGSTSLYAWSEIDANGRFTLQNKEGDRELIGTLRAGAISGQWADVRDLGDTYLALLSGTLTGRRK